MSIKFIRETKEKNWDFYPEEDYRNINKLIIQNYFRGEYKMEKDKFSMLYSPRITETEIKKKSKLLTNGLPSAFNYQ